MNHGDGKDGKDKFLSEKDKFLSEKENPQSMRKRKKLGSDEFAHAIARNVVAQVCESLGFQSSHQFALDNFADVAARYIRELGKTAYSYANLANRTHCNVFDVIQGLEHLGSVQGFSGASNVRHSLSGSGVVKDIIRYVSLADEIPFAYSIPVFPVVKERILDRSFAQAGENPPDEHIPSWLPKFPDPVTYAELSSGNEKGSETELVKVQQVEQKHKEESERSLVNLQQKLMSNGSEAGVAVEQGDAAKAHRETEINPFLVTPLQFWEKELSLPTLPTLAARCMDESLEYHQSHEVMENHVLIMEPPSQGNETTKSGEPEDKRKILLNGRPNVQFKFGDVKKSLSMVRNPQNKETEGTSPWFGDDLDGADEKKGAAEKILLENTDYPPEESDLYIRMSG